MSEENTFDSNAAEEIHAELMERWLNGRKVDSLSPKVLHDIQTILRHYSDIMVPGENVKISYPTDDSGARCSVDSRHVFIPTGQLEKGLVDDTIGSMVHELNHIKMSDSERQTWATCYRMVYKVLESIFVPETEEEDSELICLADIVFSDPTLSFSKLYSDSTKDTKYGPFLRMALKDVAFLLNAVEDVRIDSLCSPNLKKYIDGGDRRAFSSFSKPYEEGKYNKNTLMNLCFRLLFHHKGYIKDSYIEKKFGDTDYILNSSPSEYTPVVLSTFQKAIKKHLEHLWNNGVEVSISVLGGVDAADLYMSGLTEEGDSLGEDIAGGDKSIIARAENDVKDVNLAESMIGKEKSEEDLGLLRKQKIEEEHSKPKIISKILEGQIQSYENLFVHEASENLTDWDGKSQTIDYPVVVFDATK